MTDRLDQASNLGARLDASWNEARVESSLARLHSKRRRRRAIRVAAAAVVVLAGVVSALLWTRAPAVAPPAALARGEVKLRDGSSAIPLEGGQLVVAEDSANRVRVELLSGAARFESVHRPERRFAVQAGAVTVIDVGTVFVVERTAERVRVAVEAGRVRVEAPAETSELSAGEARWFVAQPAPTAPADSGAEPAVELLPVAPANGLDRRPPEAPRKPKTAAWRELATAGRYDEAFAALSPGSVRDDVEELLLAADTARLSRHPADAVPHLERVITLHAADARAPAAAFTLGKVLLALERPLDAASAFATVRKLAPGGTLDEDALAREAEAWSAAGHHARAGESAREYLRLYPDGAWAGSMHRLDGTSP